VEKEDAQKAYELALLRPAHAVDFLGDVLDVGLSQLSRAQKLSLLTAPGKKIAVIQREASIRVQRNRLADHLDGNPSLKPLLPTALASAYRDAALEAVAETELAAATYPVASPWTVEEVLDGGFWPG